MSAVILPTKLHIPSPRQNIVVRSRLAARLNEGLHRKLTLLSAPAGFGKTTLLSDWINSGRHPAAWLSLDEGDSEPVRFWAHFIASIKIIVSTIRAEVSDAFQSPQPPPIESILSLLIDDIETTAADFIFVLDDYHTIDSKQIDANLTFLIERLPAKMHLVIATREDPSLSLARLRARDQLVEIRVADLRFTTSETTEFLNQTMGLQLSAEDIGRLETRTEGWITGLQLAALSMQGLEDKADVIKSFTGSHHFVLDYLLEEVLQKQPGKIQTFLISTSILNRLCGSLCDAVLNNPPGDGQETLEYLKKSNLFVISLDNERKWYRYHRLFAELLHNRLLRTYPDRLKDLHGRASNWCASNDLPSEAVTHALDIQDWPRAAEIIERFSDQWPMRGETNSVLKWIESFPPQVRLDRPKLGVCYAWSLFMTNHFERTEQFLDELLPYVQSLPQHLGEVYTIRVMLAARRFDIPAVFKLGRQALSLIPPEMASLRSRILLCFGVALNDNAANIKAAKDAFRESYETGMKSPESMVGNAPVPLTALAYLSEIELLQGNLNEAFKMNKRAIELAGHWGAQSSIALCLAQRTRADLLYEWNDLKNAEQALQESIRIGEVWRSPFFLVPAYGLLAIVMQNQGRQEEASAAIERAEQVTRDLPASPMDLAMLAFYQLRLWTAQNNLQAVAQWERENGSATRQPQQPDRSSFHLATVRAQARLTQYYQNKDKAALSQARRLLGPALEESKGSGLLYLTVRLQALDGLALYLQGETKAAAAILQQALEAAAAENYVRSFLDIGKPMAEFLLTILESRLLSEPNLRSYAERLLSDFSKELTAQITGAAAEKLVEPLSQRELEVLRLISIGLSNREISERLFVALSTVKGHSRVIFDKLQVQNRTQAVARARELRLI